MTNHIRNEGPVVFHVPDGQAKTVILEAPTTAHARKVVARLISSGVDWSQPHSAATHKAMRAAIVAATSDGTVTTKDYPA